jgi:hypothetical protein
MGNSVTSLPHWLYERKTPVFLAMSEDDVRAGLLKGLSLTPEGFEPPPAERPRRRRSVPEEVSSDDSSD